MMQGQSGNDACSYTSNLLSVNVLDIRFTCYETIPILALSLTI
jgi:hypothetical protein